MQKFKTLEQSRTTQHHERTVKKFFKQNWRGPSANFKKPEGARLQIFKTLGGGPGPPPFAGPYGRYAYAQHVQYIYFTE